jgi:uncharacterized membrane protein
MLHINENIDINMPVNKVFAYISDLNHLPEWQNGVIKSQVLTAGPTRVGTKFTEDVKLMFWTKKTNCEITQLEPNRKMTFEALGGPWEYIGSFDFKENSPVSTTLSVSADLNFKGFWKLLESMFDGETKRETRKELETIKAKLEN